jgi:hypothetical protein
MSRAMKAGAFGAAAGFFVMVCILLFHVRSPLIVNALWPTHFLANTAKGSLWMLTFGTLGFFANAFLYGLIGYGIGRLMYGNQPPPQRS